MHIQTLSQKKKAGYIRSQRARQKVGRKNPDQNTVTAQQRQIFFKLHTSLSCMPAAHESGNFHTNPFVSQHSSHLYQPQPLSYFNCPRQRSTQLAHTTIVYTQSPASLKIHLHRPYITPSKRTFRSRKACDLIKKSRTNIVQQKAAVNTVARKEGR